MRRKPIKHGEYRRIKEDHKRGVKTGRWIPVTEYEACGGDYGAWQAHGDPVAYYYCSECREQAGLSEFGKDLTTKYCPECGARMVNGI